VLICSGAKAKLMLVKSKSKNSRNSSAQKSLMAGGLILTKIALDIVLVLVGDFELRQPNLISYGLRGTAV